MQTRTRAAAARCRPLPQGGGACAAALKPGRPDCTMRAMNRFASQRHAGGEAVAAPPSAAPAGAPPPCAAPAGAEGAPLGPAAAAAFYLELAREAGGPVLELGCGSGAVLLEIASAGFPCSGVDASASLLAELRRRGIPPSLRLARASLQAFDLGPDRFMLIYAAAGALQRLLAIEDQLACLARVRRHLAPGGLFAFDVRNPELPPELCVEPRRHACAERAGEGQRLRVRSHCQRWAEAEPGAAPPAARELHCFFRSELEQLLERAGFSRADFYGDFQRSALTADNGFVVVARS
jgi:SAM-dependent methyltransferase